MDKHCLGHSVDACRLGVMYPWKHTTPYYHHFKKLRILAGATTSGGHYMTYSVDSWDATLRWKTPAYELCASETSSKKQTTGQKFWNLLMPQLWPGIKSNFSTISAYLPICVWCECIYFLSERRAARNRRKGVATFAKGSHLYMMDTSPGSRLAKAVKPSRGLPCIFF